MAEELTINGAHVKRRHPFGPLGLTIITLGIYFFVWWYKINREMRDLGEKVDPVVSLLAVTVGWVIIVPPFVSVYNTAERIRHTRVRAGAETTSVVEGEMIPVLALILFIVPVLGLLFEAYLQQGLNTAYDRMVTEAAGIGDHHSATRANLGATETG